MKSLKLLLLIIFISCLTIFIIFETYSYGYLVVFVVSILLLLGVLGLNNISGRKLSINAISVSLIVAYILISLSYIISSDLDFSPRMIISLLLLIAISVELTSEFISSSVILKYIKVFVVLVMSKVIGIVSFIKYLGNNTLKSNNKVLNTVINTFTLLLTILLTIGIIIYLTGFIFPNYLNEFFKTLYPSILNNDSNVLFYIFSYLTSCAIGFLLLGTEFTFIRKLSEIDFKKSEPKISLNFQVFFVKFIQILLVLLDIGLLLILFISVGDRNSSFLESIRIKEFALLSSIGIALLYFSQKGVKNIEFSMELSKFIKFNSLTTAVLNISVLLITIFRLGQHEAILGFTQNRIHANLISIVLIALIIYMIIPFLNFKRILEIRKIIIPSLIIFIGFSITVPWVYVSNKINLEMYKTGILKEFDITYSTEYLPYMGDSREWMDYAKDRSGENQDGYIVFIDYLKHLKENNIEYPRSDWFRLRMAGLGRIFTRVQSRSVRFRDFNIMHKILIDEFMNNKVKLELKEDYDG